MSIQDSINSALGSAANAVQTNKLIQGQELENNLRKIQVQESTTNQRNDIVSNKNEVEDLTKVEGVLTGKLDQANNEINNFKGKKTTKKGKNTKKYQTLLDAAAEAGSKLDEVVNMKRTLQQTIKDKISKFNASAEAYTKAGIKVDKIEEVK
jgi:predicted  nucleic acid-binding Zn-ribbon protein